MSITSNTTELKDILNIVNNMPVMGDADILNAKKWLINIAQDFIATAEQRVLTLVSADNWLKEHRENSALCAIIKPNFSSRYTDTNMFGMGFSSNRTTAEGRSYQSFGYAITSSSISGGVQSASLTQTWDTQHLYIDTDGSLVLRLGTGVKLVAGKYTVVAWMEA